MKTVLFTWELGGGMGHVMSLSRFAARLARHDVRLVAAAKNLESARILHDAGVETLQAPQWPVDFLTSAERATQSSATMHDVLAAFGLAEEDALRKLLGQWDAILKAVQPDLVVADYAPLSGLMSYGRIPLLIAGNGYTLPPSEMKRFPLIHRSYAPQLNEEETLATVNRALRSVGRSALERLPQIFAADARFVETFPLLDPYAVQRLAPANGPVFESPPIARGPDADAILVYLSRGCELHPDIVDALQPFASRLYIHAPELTSDQSADFARQGARIHANMLPLRETLPAARLVIHLGGSGLAAEALTAGVPQLVLATHIEQQLNGAVLEDAGLGQMIRAFDAQSRISSGMIEALLADDAMAQRAIRVGEQHRDMLETLNPLATFETAAVNLLNA